MQDLEIRLLKSDRHEALVYKIRCRNAVAAHISQIIAEHNIEDHFEVWRGMDLIADGPLPPPN